MTPPPRKPLAAVRVALFLALLGVFGWGVLQLFAMRFDVGDIYPPYSSSRADPLGTRALRESLLEIEGMEVLQHRDPIDKLTMTSETALLIAGAEPLETAWDTGAKPFEQRVFERGARLVIAFAPTSDDFFASETQRIIDNSSSPTLGINSDPSTDSLLSEVQEGQRMWALLAITQGVWIGWKPMPRDEDADPLDPVEPVEAQRAEGAPASLPAFIALRTGRVFDGVSPEWRVLYKREDKPVLIERDVSSGTLVLAADAFYLSNESLRGERQTELLAWTLGGKRRIVFDEGHLGVRQEPGVVKLARQLGLGGTLIGLVVLGGLFIWRSATSLVPPRDERDLAQAAHGMAAGRDSAAGFVNLLRHHIPHSRLLPLCLDQWRLTYLQDHRELAPRAVQMDQILNAELSKTPGLRNTPEAYRQMSRALKKRSTTP